MRPGTTSNPFPIGTFVKFASDPFINLYRIDRVTLKLDTESYYHMTRCWPKPNSLAGAPHSHVIKARQPDKHLITFWLAGGSILLKKDPRPPWIA